MAKKIELATWSNLIAAIGGAATVGLVYKRVSRPRDLRWLDHAHQLPHAITSTFRVIEGVRLHYQEVGLEQGGETLILLHGFGAFSYAWRDCLLPLAEMGYRVIALDLKGFGFSEKPVDNRYDIMDQVKLIVSLMDNLGIEKATLVGNSYGGAISMACALKYPQRVQRLVLLAPAHNNRVLKRGIRYGDKIIKIKTLADIMGSFFFGSGQVVNYYIKRMFYNQDLATPDVHEAYHRVLRTANLQHAALMTFRQWRLDWIEREMSEILAPTLIVWGEQDWALPVEWGTEIHFAIPHSEFIVIPQCGHLPQEEYPKDTCQLIVDFCDRYKHATQLVDQPVQG